MQGGSDLPNEPSLEIARDLVRAGQIDQAEQAYLKAIEARPPGEGRAALLSELAEALQRFGRELDAIPYLKQALEEHREPDSALFETLQNQLALCLLLTDRAADARGRTKLAPWLAEVLGNPRLQGRGAMMRAELLGHHLHLKAAAREYERAAQFGLEAQDWALVARGWHRAATQHLQMGNLKKGLQYSSKALDAAKQWRDLTTLLEIHSIRALMYQMRGDWQRTRAALREGSKVLEHLGHPPAEAFYLISVDWYLRLWLGDDQALVELEAEMRETEFPHATNEPARWIGLVKNHVYQGRLEDARNELRDAVMRVPPAPPESGPIDAWLVAAFNLADCICDIGDAEAALARYEHLTQYAHLLVPHALPTLVLGRIASLNGMWKEAGEWFSEAHSLAVRAAMLPYEALVNYEFGLLYERRGDRSPAEQYLRRAAGLFEELGMLRYQKQALVHIKALGGLSTNGMLTKTETKVICKWVDGKPTADAIAAQLGVDVATVRKQIQNAYKKMGVHDRTEARAWAIDHGLISVDGSEQSSGK